MKSCVGEHKNLEDIKDGMLDEQVVQKLAEIFKVFGDVTRLKIIQALLQKEICVCDICEVVGMSQSSVSHQLRLLKAKNLVKYRRDGKTIYYSLDDEHVDLIYRYGLDHVMHKHGFED